MKSTASDTLIDAIHDWGVDVVFGLPGDGINGIMEQAAGEGKPALIRPFVPPSPEGRRNR